MKADIELFDEGNLGDLALISFQQAIPSGYNSWKRQFIWRGKPASVECSGGADYGVPHGLDSDVMLSLIAIFQEAGMPSSGEIEASPYKILTTVGLPTSQHYYNALKTSLKRLAATTYFIEAAWRENGRYQNSTLRHIEELTFKTQHSKSREPQPKTMDDETAAQIELLTPDEKPLVTQENLSIRLGRPLVNSLRKKFFRMIDYSLFSQLKRIQTRNLYRVLETKRLPTDSTEPLPVFSENLLAWAENLTILNDTPNKIKRALEPSHQELQEHGYLLRVEYTGGRKATRITYYFANQAPIDPDTTRLLTENGLSLVNAQRYARMYGRDYIHERVALFKHLISQQGGNIRSKPAFLVDILNDKVGKYTTSSKITQGSLFTETDSGTRPNAKKHTTNNPVEMFDRYSQQERLQLVEVQFAVIFGSEMMPEQQNKVRAKLESNLDALRDIFIHSLEAIKTRTESQNFKDIYRDWLT